MGVTEQEYFEASEDPDTFIAKYGYDRWQHVQQVARQAIESSQLEGTYDGATLQRAIDALGKV